MHSCLSPCGDDDMTPNNIAGMGVLNGLNIMALTDHNTTKNCPAFFKAAKKQGIIPIAGMELTTAEDIHAVCLFPDLESALLFSAEIENRLIKDKWTHNKAIQKALESYRVSEEHKSHLRCLKY